MSALPDDAPMSHHRSHGRTKFQRHGLASRKMPEEAHDQEEQSLPEKAHCPRILAGGNLERSP